jgi:hypothetical protein
LTAKGRLLRVRSGHAEVEVQRDADRRDPPGTGWRVLDEHVYVDDGISGAEFLKRLANARR